MTETEEAAYHHMANSCKTRYPRDLASQAILIRSAKSPTDKTLILRSILWAREDWMIYLTIQQRKWQQETRNPNKARHHDSIAIREKYVR